MAYGSYGLTEMMTITTTTALRLLIQEKNNTLGKDGVGNMALAGGQALLQRKTRCIYLGRELCVFLLLFSLGPTAKRWMREYPLYSSCLRALAFFSSECNYKDDISTTIPQRYYILENCLHVYELCIHGETFLFLGVAKTSTGRSTLYRQSQGGSGIDHHKKTSSHAQRSVRNKASGPLLHDDA